VQGQDRPAAGSSIRGRHPPIFLHGLPQLGHLHSRLRALRGQDRVRASCFDAARTRCYYAEKGQGAWIERFQAVCALVSRHQMIERRFLPPVSPFAAKRTLAFATLFGRIWARLDLAECAGCCGRLGNSAALDLAYCEAAGRFTNGYWKRELQNSGICRRHLLDSRPKAGAMVGFPNSVGRA